MGFGTVTQLTKITLTSALQPLLNADALVDVVTLNPRELLKILWDFEFQGGAVDDGVWEVLEGLLISTGQTAQAGAAATITLASVESTVDDHFNQFYVVTTGGTGLGQLRKITDYVGSSRVATVGAWTVEPDSTTTYDIYAFAVADTATMDLADTEATVMTSVVGPKFVAFRVKQSGATDTTNEGRASYQVDGVGS